MEKAGAMRGKPKSSALWNTRGSGNQTNIDQGKSKKADTNLDKSNPEQEGTCDSGYQQKDDTLKKRDRVSPKWPTRSPRRYDSTSWKLEIRIQFSVWNDLYIMMASQTPLIIN